MHTSSSPSALEASPVAVVVTHFWVSAQKKKKIQKKSKILSKNNSSEK